jgi:hypothetical protein
MIHAFCDRKGSGKTKALINLANDKACCLNGDIVYIAKDSKSILQLNRKIRYISTDEFNLKTYSEFYGFLCGIFSKDYDVDTIYIDGIFDVVGELSEDMAHLFFEMDFFAKKYGIEIFININIEKDYLPEYVRKYVA